MQFLRWVITRTLLCGCLVVAGSSVYYIGYFVGLCDFFESPHDNCPMALNIWPGIGNYLLILCTLSQIIAILPVYEINF